MKNIRIWKLGDHKEGILPDSEAIKKLLGLLKVINSDEDDDTFDIVWDSMISVTVIKDGKVTSDHGLSSEDIERIKEGLSNNV